MEALLVAHNYDIEIVHNSLLIFGQIQDDPEAQISEMSQCILIIRKKLLNNILTYRDERVSYEKVRKVVARAGMFLEKNPYGGLLLWMILAIIYSIPVIFVFILLDAVL